jgi:hypothetical protein
MSINAPTPAGRPDGAAFAGIIAGTSAVGINGDMQEVVVPITPAGKQLLNNPAMLRDIAHGADPAATARFVGPYLVVTGPSGSG